jgi:uncharacterized membrane protein YraQ (UPF0718 family)
VNGSLLFLAAILAILGVVAFVIGGAARVADGVRESVSLLTGVAPQLVVGFLMAGFVIALVPSTLIARLVGTEAGLPGLALATVAGALTPGGPFLQFPLVATLLRGGAGEGPVAAYLTAWSLLGLQRVFVWELPVLGPGFAAARWTVSLALPILVGLAIPLVMRAVRE